MNECVIVVTWTEAASEGNDRMSEARQMQASLFHSPDAGEDCSLRTGASLRRLNERTPVQTPD